LLGLPIKRRNLKGKVKLCPKCLSQLAKFGNLSGWMLPEEYVCYSCGYLGHVAIEPSAESAILEDT
jgi:ribosomal protein S27AE